MASLLKRIYAFNQTDRDLWIERVAKSIPSGWRVLDVGAGGCPYRSLFAHCRYETHDFARLDASDLSNQSGYGRIDYVSDITAIPVADASFDAVICTEVLEHVPDPVAAIREMARLLRPGGRLFLTAPLGSGLHQQPYHFYGGFTPYWYQRFLPEAGFRSVEVQPNGGFFKFYGQETQRLNVLLHPSRYRGLSRLFAGVGWLLTYPLRIVVPAISYLVDAADKNPDFTIGYHVTAERVP